MSETYVKVKTFAASSQACFWLRVEVKTFPLRAFEIITVRSGFLFKINSITSEALKENEKH